jgi:endonuclease YncB( thermonuclease family)
MSARDLKFMMFAAAGLSTMPTATAQTAPPTCDLTVIATAKATLVRDGRTFLLEDGREVRLAGLEVPALETSQGAQAKTELEGLIGGKMLTLKNAAATQDRYGRIVAYVFSGEQSIQNEMLAAGWAQVSALAGGCARELQNIEHQARDNRQGMWSTAAYAPIEANTASMYPALRGHFALIEGEVLSVRESGAILYVNFGRHFTRDFTVTILRRNQRLFSTALGIDPKQLAGKRIRVRGVIEQRGGPIIEAARPEQIELAN